MNTRGNRGRRYSIIPPLPALGNAQQLQMEELMEPGAQEEEEEEVEYHRETVDVAALPALPAAGPIDDALPSSPASSVTEVDAEAIAQAQEGGGGDFDAEQVALNMAADDAREEESFQSFFQNVMNVDPKDKFQYIMMVARGVVFELSGGDVVDMSDLEPFKAAIEAKVITKSQLKVTIKLAGLEIKRRNPDRPLNRKNKPVKELVRILTEEMPINSIADREFIRKEFNSMKGRVVAALEEHNSRSVESSQRSVATL